MGVESSNVSLKDGMVFEIFLAGGVSALEIGGDGGFIGDGMVTLVMGYEGVLGFKRVCAN